MKNLKIKTEKVHEQQRLDIKAENYTCAAIEDAAKKQNLNVTCALELLDQEILATGEVNGTVTVACSRCLEEYEHPVRLKIVQSFPAEAPEIDLEGEVRELVVLNMPEKPLCDEACKGLCPQCGKNLNREQCTCTVEIVDPRWNALKDLVKKKK